MPDDFLWQHQWDSLDSALADAGCHPSAFEQRESVFRDSWLGRRELPRPKQFAGLFHNAFNDIFLEVRVVDEPRDADGDVVAESGWNVTASPSPNSSARRSGAQRFEVDDFEEVVDVAREWAHVAARELRARGVLRQTRAQAKDEWGERTSRQNPLEITRVSGFVREELPGLVEDGLRRGGADDDTIAAVLRALLADSPDTIKEAESTDTMSRDFPKIFARRVLKSVGDTVTDKTAQLVIKTVTVGVGAFFRLF